MQAHGPLCTTVFSFCQIFKMFSFNNLTFTQYNITFKANITVLCPLLLMLQPNIHVEIPCITLGICNKAVDVMRVLRQSLPAMHEFLVVIHVWRCPVTGTVNSVNFIIPCQAGLTAWVTLAKIPVHPVAVWLHTMKSQVQERVVVNFCSISINNNSIDLHSIFISVLHLWTTYQ